MCPAFAGQSLESRLAAQRSVIRTQEPMHEISVIVARRDDAKAICETLGWAQALQGSGGWWIVPISRQFVANAVGGKLFGCGCDAMDVAIGSHDGGKAGVARHPSRHDTVLVLHPGNAHWHHAQIRAAAGNLMAALVKRNDACLPSTPQYWRVTPTECVPFLGQPVSSRIHQPPELKFITGTTHCATRRRSSWSLHWALATK